MAIAVVDGLQSIAVEYIQFLMTIQIDPFRWQLPHLLLLLSFFLHRTSSDASLSRPNFLFLGDSTMRRTAMQFALQQGCDVKEQSPGCNFDKYFGLERDEGQRWPPGPCEGPAVNGHRNRGKRRLR